MIVKNEKEVITRCLESVRPLIDYWVIVDTGSTDGTQEVILDYFKDIPGELYERPWVNFAHNRNEALQLAKYKADYTLIMDADDFLTYSPGFQVPLLTLDYYHLQIEDRGTRYYRTHLVNNNFGWIWRGVLHEYLAAVDAQSMGILPNVSYVRFYDGARSKDIEKYQKDVQVLLKALKMDPTNDRYVFYLAESYKSAQQFDKAIEVYQQRTTMGGWDEEIFWSLLQIGVLKEALKFPAKEVIEAFKRAASFRPQRMEPYYYLCRFYRLSNNFFASYVFGQKGLTIPLPNDGLFVENWIYDYGLLFEYSVTAYWVEDYLESQKASYELLANPNLPDYIRELVIKNLEWINQKVEQIGA